ncbi:hypothetical protein BX600DRAFT_434664 [Xylariales sp. PMI_506]|nr:hypothetical protein BX600DRAFT_434664 [Xylariales sp. PMI_506]
MSASTDNWDEMKAELDKMSGDMTSDTTGSSFLKPTFRQILKGLPSQAQDEEENPTVLWNDEEVVLVRLLPDGRYAWFRDDKDTTHCFNFPDWANYFENPTKVENGYYIFNQEIKKLQWLKKEEDAVIKEKIKGFSEGIWERSAHYNRMQVQRGLFLRDASVATTEGAGEPEPCADSRITELSDADEQDNKCIEGSRQEL